MRPPHVLIFTHKCASDNGPCRSVAKAQSAGSRGWKTPHPAKTSSNHREGSGEKASLPESREKTRLDAGNRRSRHQQCTPNQWLTREEAPGALRDASERGRSASEGTSREGEPGHDAHSLVNTIAL